PAVRRHARGGARPPPARRRLPGDPAGGRRDPLDRAATRAASEEQLADHGRRWLAEMLSHGTTTIEAKSGYGLDLPSELRLLDVAHRLGREGPVEVLPTWLGAHAVAPEFRDRPDGTEAYVRYLIEEQLPGVVA